MPASRDEYARMTVRLYEEVLNQGKLEVLDELALPDHVEHHPFPGQSQGIDGLKQRVSMVRAAFNPHFTIEHLLVDGNKVAVMWTNASTHLTEWLGFPPTGKRLSIRGVDIHLFRDSRLAEHWDLVDVYAMLVQIGAAPAPNTSARATR